MSVKNQKNSWQNRIVRTGEKPAREFNFHPDNWRGHPQSQRDALNAILSQVGWVQGVIVNGHTGFILDGHARVEEALELDENTPVPFVEVDLSVEEERLILLLLDPIGSMAQTNAEAFLNLSQSLEIDSAALLDAVAGINVQLDAFDMSDLRDDSDGRFSSLEQAAAVNEKWQVRSGDLWEIGSHRILCGDSTKAADANRLMGSEDAELLFTSPPYADQRIYSGEDDLLPVKLARFIEAFADFCAYQVVNLGIVRADYEVLEYWQHYIAAARTCGYKLLSWNVWDRGQANSIGQQTAMFAIDHEFIFVFGNRVKKLTPTIPTRDSSRDRQKYKHRRSRRNEKGDLELTEQWEQTKPFKQLGTVQRINCANTIGESIHPAMFPVELPATYIEAMTAKNQIVCEPFLGSGTTIIACENLQRRCYAMEISPDYVAVALERLGKIFGITPKRID